MSIAVVTVASGGIPVVVAANGIGTPVTEASNGRGLAVTQVVRGAMPVVYAATTVQTSGPPAPQLALLTDGDTAITITFTKPLDTSSVPPASAFLAVRNFVGKTPISVAVSGSQVKLTFDAAYPGMTGIMVNYTASSPALRGIDAQVVASFSNYPVGS